MARLKTTIAICALALTNVAIAAAPAAAKEESSEVRELRDRTAVHDVLLAYGRLIDERDFAGFGALFTADGTYGNSTGPEAIAAGMAANFKANPFGFRDPNFHVFFNERIQLHGDTATAQSTSFYVVPDDVGGFRIALMASYDDELVRVGDTWKFKRRTVKGHTPSKPAK
jgi:hypothetical protein